MPERKKEYRKNPQTGKKEVRFEGDLFWTEAK